MKCFGVLGFHLKSFVIEVEESITLLELLDKIEQDVTEDLKNQLLKDGLFKTDHYLLINSKPVDANTAVNIKPGDEVLISKVLTGG